MLVSLKGDINMEEKIVLILNEMSEYLSIAQMKKCYQEPSEQLRKSLSKRNFINIYKEDLL